MTLAWTTEGLGQLDETFVEAKVVPNGIFPALKKERKINLKKKLSPPFARRKRRKQESACF
jgi:hypothetical protein